MEQKPSKTSLPGSMDLYKQKWPKMLARVQRMDLYEQSGLLFGGVILFIIKRLFLDLKKGSETFPKQSGS